MTRRLSERGAGALQDRVYTIVGRGGFANWVENLYEDNVTGGCATDPLRYCPLASITRGQMAVFLTKAFQLH